MKHHTCKVSSLLMALVLASAAPFAFADDLSDLNKGISSLDEIAKTTAGQARVLEKISTATGIPTTKLYQEHSDNKLGFGELEISHLLATATGKTFDQIAAEFKSGKGWGKIAEENGVKLGGLVSKVHESAHASEHAHQGGPGNGHGQGNSGGGSGHGGGHGGGHGKGR